MAEFHILPFYTDSYLGDTTHLTTLEHGAYLLLLFTAWRSPGTSLPDDDKKLARYARLTLAQWKRIKPTIAAFFVIENDSWTQPRLTDEAVGIRRKREAAHANGRASALKRHGSRVAKRDDPLPVCSNKEPANGQLSISISRSTPSSNEEGHSADPDKVFWDNAKAYLGKSKASMIGRWVRDHGREVTAAAVSAAQVERAVDPVSFIERKLRGAARQDDQPRVPL